MSSHIQIQTGSDSMHSKRKNLKDQITEYSQFWKQLFCEKENTKNNEKKSSHIPTNYQV